MEAGAESPRSRSPRTASGSGSRLYRILFGHRTVLLEGYLLLGGIGVHLAGRLLDQPAVASFGLWLTLPFIATLLIALLVLAPWFWFKRRQRS